MRTTTPCGPSPENAAHRVRLGHALQGDRHEQKRLSLDIHDPLVGRYPAVGRSADIDQQEDGHVAPGLAIGLVQRLSHRQPGPQVGKAVDIRVDVDVVAIELLTQPHSLRTKHLEAPPHEIGHRQAFDECPVDPLLRTFRGRPHVDRDGALVVGLEPAIPLRIA